MFEWSVLVPSSADAAMIALALVLMALDVVSGFIAACVRHVRSSAKMRAGLGHKAELVCIVVAMYAVEKLCAVGGFPVDLPTGIVTAGYIAVMEAMSVVENTGKAYPAFKRSALYAMIVGNDKVDKE